jgi:hypothetical protein
MKIRFTDSVAGARFAYRMGQVADVPAAVAREFIASRQAEIFIDEAERAVAPAPETAVGAGQATGRRGRRRGVRAVMADLLP